MENDKHVCSRTDFSLWLPEGVREVLYIISSALDLHAQHFWKRSVRRREGEERKLYLNNKAYCYSIAGEPASHGGNEDPEIFVHWLF